MTVIFKSELLGCEINSNMSKVYLQNLGDTIQKKLLRAFNKKFNLNGTSLDDILNYLENDEYTLVLKYKNAHHFLFDEDSYKNMNIALLAKLLKKATSCGIEVYCVE